MSQPAELRCYGQPLDGRGWRQFLVERLHPQRPADEIRRAGAIPCVLWISDRTIACDFCGGLAHYVHPSSSQAVGEAVGQPVPLSAVGNRLVCECMGHFLE